MLETGRPLHFYLPREDVRAHLRPSARRSVCPYKGLATYWSLDDIEDAAWSYEDLLEAMTKAAGFMTFDTRKAEVREIRLG